MNHASCIDPVIQAACESCRILFAMGDVGGTRAMLPVIQQAVDSGAECHVVNHGFVESVQRVDKAIYHSLPVELSDVQIDQFLCAIEPDSVAFTTSVADTLALRIAYRASRSHVPTAHLLDFWSNYANRLMMENNTFHVPDIYAVMDSHAAGKVVEAGLPEQTVKITGSPAFSHISRQVVMTHTLEKSQRHQFVFVSEPISQDVATQSSCGLERGYSQSEVLSLILDALNRFNQSAIVRVFPHPRENTVELEECWKEHSGLIDGGLVDEVQKSQLLAECSGVIGMSSVLLYEAWLCGHPVLSVQPNLQLESLRFYASKKGLTFVDRKSEFPEVFRRWLDGVSEGYRPDKSCKLELEDHRHAVSNFLRELFHVSTLSNRNSAQTRYWSG